MNIWSLLFGIAALLVFLIDAFWTPNPPSPRGPRSLQSLGLALFVACFMAQLLIVASDPIHF